MDVIADFAAAYAPNIGLLFRIDIVETLIIEPRCCFRIIGRTARPILSADVVDFKTCIPGLEFHFSRVSNGGWTNALFTRTSIWPNSEIVEEIRLSISGRSEHQSE